MIWLGHSKSTKSFQLPRQIAWDTLSKVLSWVVDHRRPRTPSWGSPTLWDRRLPLIWWLVSSPLTQSFSCPRRSSKSLIYRNMLEASPTEGFTPEEIMRMRLMCCETRREVPGLRVSKRDTMWHTLNSLCLITLLSRLTWQPREKRLVLMHCTSSISHLYRNLQEVAASKWKTRSVESQEDLEAPSHWQGKCLDYKGSKLAMDIEITL